jgi:hypothetical protein
VWGWGGGGAVVSELPNSVNYVLHARDADGICRECYAIPGQPCVGGARCLSCGQLATPADYASYKADPETWALPCRGRRDGLTHQWAERPEEVTARCLPIGLHHEELSVHWRDDLGRTSESLCFPKPLAAILAARINRPWYAIRVTHQLHARDWRETHDDVDVAMRALDVVSEMWIESDSCDAIRNALLRIKRRASEGEIRAVRDLHDTERL